MTPVVIPMARPGAGWHDSLLRDLRNLHAIERLVFGGRAVLCIFCRMPHKLVPMHHRVLGFASTNFLWLLELPDGTRLELGRDYRQVICGDCCRIISPPPRPGHFHHYPIVGLCAQCGAMILLTDPHVYKSRVVTQTMFLVHSTSGSTAREPGASLHMCLHCLRQLTKDARCFPYETPGTYRGPYAPGSLWSWYSAYVIEHRPQAFPVRYAPELREAVV